MGIFGIMADTNRDKGNAVLSISPTQIEKIIIMLLCSCGRHKHIRIYSYRRTAAIHIVSAAIRASYSLSHSFFMHEITRASTHTRRLCS